MQTQDPWLMFALNFLPYVLLFGFFVLVLRWTQKGGMTNKLVENSHRLTAATEAIANELREMRNVLEQIRDRPDRPV